MNVRRSMSLFVSRICLPSRSIASSQSSKDPSGSLGADYGRAVCLVSLVPMLSPRTRHLWRQVHDMSRSNTRRGPVQAPLERATALHVRRRDRGEGAMTPAAINRRLASVPAEALVARALGVLEERLRYPDTVLTSPNVVRDYLRLRLAAREREAFLCIWLDAQHSLIECVQLLAGKRTLTRVFQC